MDIKQQQPSAQSLMENVVPVILSGGSGTRLWPTSRKKFPKQLLKLNEIKRLGLTEHQGELIIRAVTQPCVLAVLLQ